MAKVLGPSNDTDTCLYCGKALAYRTRKEVTYRNTVSLCCQAPLTYAYDHRGMATHDYLCSRCRMVMTDDTQEVVTRTEAAWRAEKSGPYQDGMFCTLDCGYRFGVLAATKGTRFVKRKD